MKDADNFSGREPEPGDRKFDELLGALEQLADRLDHERFPGRAWIQVPARSYRIVWKVAAIGLAAAAAIAIAAYLWPAGQVKPADHREVVVKPAPALPRLVIIEDLDSYSIIDLNSTQPIASFSSKNDPAAPPEITVIPVQIAKASDHHHM